MAIKWNDLDEVEATELILGSAISANASVVHLSCDGDGGAIFFLVGGTLEYFDQIPMACRERVSHYLRIIAGIDDWKRPVERGNGLFTYGGENHLFEVEIRRGKIATDTRISLLREDDTACEL